MERAKALQLQVQTATFQKMEDDIQSDIAALKKWASVEDERKRNWNSAVLTHKRKRYVKGLAAVRELASHSFRCKTTGVERHEMELAAFRTAADSARPAGPEDKFLGLDLLTFVDIFFGEP